ncbi:hypothetical protein EV363DRAFT_1347131 [Boletus edulis]|nr:hypothetical protein EV363DRAFT_1347131 [Boletus edulis]
MNSNTNATIDHQSSTSPPTSPSHLQRGKACLSCRRRKMKCDGTKPVCTPCLRGERAEDCEYTDGQRRPRMLTLEEDIVRLRTRVQELENPGDVIPGVELHAPYAVAGPSMTRSTSMGHAQHAPVPVAYHQAGSSRSHAIPRADPVRVDSEAAANVIRALSVIAPYAAEIGLFLNLDRLRVQGAHILPALQRALTLWSVHITSTSQENHAQTLQRTEALTSNLLAQAQTQLASALSIVDSEPDPAIFLHVIQTGVLLAYYMQRIGQVVGARYYASGTWALAMMLKLHQSPYLSLGSGGGGSPSLGRSGLRDPTHGSTIPCPFAFAGCATLAPAVDGIEAEERVRAFWTVYALDRWFSALGQGSSQPLIMDENAMTVPWPDIGAMNEARNVARHLLNNPSPDFMRDSPSAMHAKASVLLGEAVAVAASIAGDHAIGQSPAFRVRFGTLDTLLQRCMNAAMMVATGPRSQTQAQTQALVTVHLVALAHVTLHRPFISNPYGSYQRRCAEAAFGVVQALDHMGEVGVGVGSASPLYAIVWTALCLALHDDIHALRARQGADPSRRREEREMLGVIRKLASLLCTVSQHSPGRFFAIKIEAVLPILESIAL